jgi:hypothetical protein
MTDKELLELAAKAIGLDATNHPAHTDDWSWNPLTDDGDAFRLMVSLRLCVAIEFDRIDAITQHECATEYLYDKPQTDYYAATRRAIVRAAAAIGKEMNHE